ncbi:sensor histidine kinase [Streptomyces sp. PTD5-9]|uniref:sensor histidine kinase n=1 Tax=Streptomyces sp. PTD5-9 TaxID=3120150 RepID=UPI003009E2CF
MPQPPITSPAPAPSAGPGRAPRDRAAAGSPDPGGPPTGLSADERRRIVVGERVRFARDLHDLVGPRLSAVILQCELADRLLDGRPDTAHDQLAQALRGMRRILDEVRTVAHGYHCLSLDTEIESARGLLESAGVRTETALPRAALPAPLQTVLATVVREATANVLRHSDARTCALLVETGPESVRLTVANDGVPAADATSPATDANGPAADTNGRAADANGAAADANSPATDAAGPAIGPAGPAAPGIGLRSLAERVAAAGGRLVHGAGRPGQHVLEVRFPLRPAPAPGPPGPVPRT